MRLKMMMIYLNNIKMMKKKIYGADRYRLVSFGTEVQQRLSMSRIKRLTNQIGEFSLNGLVIDWHIFEMDIEPVVEPVMAQNYQPTYAYA